jgi:hypothetical protein
MKSNESWEECGTGCLGNWVGRFGCGGLQRSERTPFAVSVGIGRKLLNSSTLRRCISETPKQVNSCRNRCKHQPQARSGTSLECTEPPQDRSAPPAWTLGYPGDRRGLLRWIPGSPLPARPGSRDLRRRCLHRRRKFDFRLETVPALPAESDMLFNPLGPKPGESPQGVFLHYGFGQMAHRDHVS